MGVHFMCHSRCGPYGATSVFLVCALLLLMPSTVSAQASLTPCRLLNGGGGLLVRNHEVVFAAQPAESGSRINGLVIVRASEKFRSQNPPRTLLERYRTGRLRHQGGGGSVGSLTFTIDSASQAVWVDDSLRVPLVPPNNVLLVQVDDRGTMKVSGTAQINPLFPFASGACATGGWPDYNEVGDTLWARFQASPLIRKFLMP